MLQLFQTLVSFLSVLVIFYSKKQQILPKCKNKNAMHWSTHSLIFFSKNVFDALNAELKPPDWYKNEQPKYFFQLTIENCCPITSFSTLILPDKNDILVFFFTKSTQVLLRFLGSVTLYMGLVFSNYCKTRICTINLFLLGENSKTKYDKSTWV